MNPKALLAMAMGLGLGAGTSRAMTHNDNGCFGKPEPYSKKRMAGLPWGYPGAKMARKAAMGRAGRTHHGLHASFTYTRHSKSKGL